MSGVPSWFAAVNFKQHDWQARWCGAIPRIAHQGWGCFVLCTDFMIVIEREESAVRVAGSSFYSWHKANDPLGTKPALAANAECSMQEEGGAGFFARALRWMHAQARKHMRALCNKSKKKFSWQQEFKFRSSVRQLCHREEIRHHLWQPSETPPRRTRSPPFLLPVSLCI